MERGSTLKVLTNQENSHERKSLKKASGKTDRVVLLPLQANSSRSKTSSDVKGQPVKGKDGGFKKRAEVKSKGVQTDSVTSIDHEMCTSDEPPLEYWRVLAERRREALAETLQENEELHSENLELRKRMAELEKRLESKDYFTLMYQIACSEKDD